MAQKLSLEEVTGRGRCYCFALLPHAGNSLPPTLRKERFLSEAHYGESGGFADLSRFKSQHCLFISEPVSSFVKQGEYHFLLELFCEG